MKFKKHKDKAGFVTFSSHYNKAVDRIEELEKEFSHFLDKAKLFLSTKEIDVQQWASYRDARKVIERDLSIEEIEAYNEL